jgi:uncharacterized membrane protein YkvI
MKGVQILILIGLVLYMLFNSINIMEQYSEESKKQFKSDRNWKIIITMIVFILLYSSGAFNLIIP